MASRSKQQNNADDTVQEEQTCAPAQQEQQQAKRRRVHQDNSQRPTKDEVINMSDKSNSGDVEAKRKLF